MARNTRAMMWSTVQPSLLKRNRLRRDTRSLGGVTFRPPCILNGLDAKEPVIVYAASGEIILRYTASEKGELNIRSSLLSTGVNIIKTKNQSFKVIRK